MIRRAADRPLHVTIVELRRFTRDTKKLIGDEELQRLVVYLSENPKAGEVMEGTGGIRKLRWALAGAGKNGGARVIYYYHNDGMPLFLLAAYPKSAKIDVTAAEKKAMARLVKALVEQHKPTK